MSEAVFGIPFWQIANMSYKGGGTSAVIRIIRQAELDLTNGGNAVSFAGGDAGLSCRLISIGNFRLLIFSCAIKTAIAAAGCTIGFPASIGIPGDTDMDTVGILFAFLNCGDSGDIHTRQLQMSVDGQTGITRLQINQYLVATGAGVNFAGVGENIRGQLSWFVR